MQPAPDGRSAIAARRAAVPRGVESVEACAESVPSARNAVLGAEMVERSWSRGRKEVRNVTRPCCGVENTVRDRSSESLMSVGNMEWGCTGARSRCHGAESRFERIHCTSDRTQGPMAGGCAGVTGLKIDARSRAASPSKWGLLALVSVAILAPTCVSGWGGAAGAFVPGMQLRMGAANSGKLGFGTGGFFRQGQATTSRRGGLLGLHSMWSRRRAGGSSDADSTGRDPLAAFLRKSKKKTDSLTSLSASTISNQKSTSEDDFSGPHGITKFIGECDLPTDKGLFRLRCPFTPRFTVDQSPMPAHGSLKVRGVAVASDWKAG
eukprot:1411229-Rhodomonas_salina.1